MKRIFIPIFVAVLFFGVFGLVSFAKATCNPPTGTINVNKSTYEINEKFTIRLFGSDDNDIKYLKICYHTEGDSQGEEDCKSDHLLFGGDLSGKLSWSLSKENPGTYYFYGYMEDSDDHYGCSAPHIDIPTDPPSITVKVIISSSKSICDYGSYTDKAGETKTADGWCTGGALCSGANCGDDTYDFCDKNKIIHYHFGCTCGKVSGCNCDENKTAKPETCLGGCSPWTCDDEGCSGGACKGKEDMPQIGTISQIGRAHV